MLKIGFKNDGVCRRNGILFFYLQTADSDVKNVYFTLSAPEIFRGSLKKKSFFISYLGADSFYEFNIPYRCMKSFNLPEGKASKSNVLQYAKDTDGFHPTQKPVALIADLIRTYSNEGDTILDNCMGSGTTAVACIKEKRHFIGFELNKEYYDKACQRIDAEQRQLTLF